MLRLKKNIPWYKRGQVLLEGLIALSLASIIIIAIVTVVTSSVSNTRTSGLKNQANQLAQEAIELVRTQRGLEEGFYCLPGGSASLSGPVSPQSCTTPNIDDTFIRSVEVTEGGCALGVDNVQVTVSWAENTCDPGEFCQSVKLASCIDPSGGLIAGNFPTPTVDPNAAPTIGTSWTPTPPAVTSTPAPTSTPTVTPTRTPTPTSAAPAPTFTFFLPNPASVEVPNGSLLSWTSTNATSCTASNGWSGSKATSGSETVNPSVTTTYSLFCSGPGGSTAVVSRTVTVTVPLAQYYSANQSSNIRSGPGTSYTVLDTIQTGGVGKRIGGPTSANGYSWYQFQTAYYGDGWSIVPNFNLVTFPTTAVAIPGSSTGTTTACTYTTDQCQRRVLFKPNFDISVTKVACRSCGAQKWWILNSTSAFAVGSALGSGTTFSTVETNWSEATLSSPLTLSRNSYYILSFGINTATATFRSKDTATNAQYVDFLQARNVTSGSTLNPGAFDVRLTVQGL